ncbi:MAG: ATP-binding protein [Bacteroidota bacterium]
MTLSIKNKLYAGLGILAFLVILLWGSGLLFINTLSENSRAIIQHNIRTVTYMEDLEQLIGKVDRLQSMQHSGELTHEQVTDSIRQAKQQAVEILNMQRSNITEDGEIALSERLETLTLEYFDQVPSIRSGDEPLYLSGKLEAIQQISHQITQLNVNAIKRKNNTAQTTASNVIFYMTVIGGISTLLALVLLIRYPGYISDPIEQLTERIKQIANQNYDQRLTFRTGDEYEQLANAFNTMATRLQEYDSSTMARIMNEKQRFEAIINHMHEAVIGLDTDNNILYVNAKAEELIGLSREALVGQPAPDIAAQNEQIQKILQHSAEDPSQLNSEQPDIIRIDDGTRSVYYAKEYIPVVREQQSRDERPIGIIITLKNVTHFQEMDEAKSNFVAVVSHELKTPISSINMSLRLLEDNRVGPLNDEQRDLVQHIRKDTQRMKKTTTELLDLSKIESGNVHLNPSKAKPIDLLEYAFETMMMQASQKEIELRIDCNEVLSEVKADVQKTVWVLVNLISNAIRYTPQEGTITLQAEDVPSYILFSVTDTGEGIPSEYLDKIFHKYFQVYGEQDHVGGSGLGLAISKEFINAQGGEIGVESTVGKGSTFYFTLPKV